MTYTLIIWTVVAMAGAGTQVTRDYRSESDWRPIAEFHSTNGSAGQSAETLCEQGAKQLGLKSGHYRCVRTK